MWQVNVLLNICSLNMLMSYIHGWIRLLDSWIIMTISLNWTKRFTWLFEIENKFVRHYCIWLTVILPYWVRFWQVGAILTCSRSEICPFFKRIFESFFAWFLRNVTGTSKKWSIYSYISIISILSNFFKFMEISNLLQYIRKYLLKFA